MDEAEPDAAAHGRRPPPPAVAQEAGVTLASFRDELEGRPLGAAVRDDDNDDGETTEAEDALLPMSVGDGASTGRPLDDELQRRMMLLETSNASV